MRANECWPLMQQAMKNNDSRSRRELIVSYGRTIHADVDDLNDPLVRDFLEMLCAYEFTLWKKNGKRSVAAYTRRALKAKGAQQFALDRVVKGGDSQGFRNLTRAGLSDFTVESLVAKYPDRFPEAVVELAVQRLREAN